MINLHENINRRNILIAIAVIFILTAAQLGVTEYVRRLESEARTLEKEARTMEATLKNRKMTVLQYNAALRINKDFIPNAYESPNVFYANLVKTLSSSGLHNAVVAKASETEGLVSFKVSGTGQYFALLDALASFRHGVNLVRLTELTLTGNADGTVTYAFTVQASVAVPSASNDAKEGVEQ